jgi:hypothetical protein
MAWRAIVTRDGLVHAQGGAGQPPDAPPDTRPVPRGALVVETRLAAEAGPQTILAMALRGAGLTTLTLRAIPGGGVVLVIAGAEALFHATVQLEADARTDILRLTYAWDVARDTGRLALEWPARQVTRIVETGRAVPLAPADIAGLGGFFDLKCAHPDLIFAAFSDDVEPVGVMPGFAVGTPISTQLGPRRADALRRGDVLVPGEPGTGPQIVLETIARSVPAFGAFRPVLLRAPYFGLHSDIVVSAEQRLLIGGSEVEYAFGCEQVLVPARHLVNGMAALWAEVGPVVRYAQVLLPAHTGLVAAGTVLESLYVGRLRRDPRRGAASLLAGTDPAFLPEHARAPLRVLSPFEAITLAERRVA